MLSLPSLPWLSSEQPEAVLWRSTLMFVALDVFFGLVGAYAYTHTGVLGVLIFIMVQQAFAILGQVVSQHVMYHKDIKPMQAQRMGVWTLALTLVFAGLAPLPVPYLLLVLCVGGGFARGFTYGARLWMEAKIGHAGTRQQYLSMVEAAGTIFKVAAPAWCLLVLFFTPHFEFIFLSAGSLFVVLLLVTKAGDGGFSSPGPYHLRALWAQKAYWTTAPYFLLEGAGHALRTALFVSGAMSVVGSLKAYAMVEVCASLVAAVWLFSQSRVVLSGPSLSKLRKFMLLLAAAWVCLLGAMWQPWIFPGFVVLYALTLPLVNAQKAGVTLGGMVKAHGGVESNLMARSVLLAVARLVTLGVFIVAYLMGTSTQALLIAMSVTAILLLPIEYWTAKRLHRSPAPMSVYLGGTVAVAPGLDTDPAFSASAIEK